MIFTVAARLKHVHGDRHLFPAEAAGENSRPCTPREINIG